MDRPPTPTPTPTLSPETIASTRARRGGRSARVVHRVLGAAFDLLAQGGFPALVVAEVAERAGVHPTSVYRRWPTREALALAACLAQADPAIRMPDTGSLAGDVLALAQDALAFVGSPAGRTLLTLGVGAAATAHDPRMAYWESRMTTLAPVFQRAVERGEVVDLRHARRCLEAAIAPIYLLTLVSGEAPQAWPWREHAMAVLGSAQCIAALADR